MDIKERRRKRREFRERKPGEISLQEEWHVRRHRHKHFTGVGTALEFIVKHRFGAHACGGCLILKAEMNKLGPDGCRREAKSLAEKLHKNVERLERTKRGNWIKLGEWLAYKISGLHLHKQLINEAINLYETTSDES